MPIIPFDAFLDRMKIDLARKFAGKKDIVDGNLAAIRRAYEEVQLSDQERTSGHSHRWNDHRTGQLRKYRTGEWRTGFRPVWHQEGCVHCLMCWLFCPDTAIEVENGKMIGIDYDHVRGAGSVPECPEESSEMEK